MITDLKLRQCFVCNNCRTNCPSGQECSADISFLYPRKQFVECLGEWCDLPCDLQKEKGDLKIEQLIALVKFLGTELNKKLMSHD